MHSSAASAPRRIVRCWSGLCGSPIELPMGKRRNTARGVFRLRVISGRTVIEIVLMPASSMAF
jgi:hypothetical protein